MGWTLSTSGSKWNEARVEFVESPLLGATPSDMGGATPSDMGGATPSDMGGGTPSDMGGGNMTLEVITAEASEALPEGWVWPGDLLPDKTARIWLNRMWSFSTC